MAASTCRPQPLVCVAFATSDQPHLQNTQEDTQEVTGTKENYFMQKKKKKKTIFISYCLRYERNYFWMLYCQVFKWVFFFEKEAKCLHPLGT